MPYKDKEKQAAYQREYQRMKRAGESKTLSKTLNPQDIQTAKGLRDLLTEVIAEVRAAQGDVFLKARLVGYLVSIGLKAVETADLEARLQELEERIGGEPH